MTKPFLFILFFLLGVRCICFSQVGIGATTPNPAAILELNSTDKAFVLPRMTQAQARAIASPPAGSMVFATDANDGQGCNCVFEGNGWHCLYCLPVTQSMCRNEYTYFPV